VRAHKAALSADSFGLISAGGGDHEQHNLTCLHATTQLVRLPLPLPYPLSPSVGSCCVWRCVCVQLEVVVPSYAARLLDRPLREAPLPLSEGWGLHWSKELHGRSGRSGWVGCSLSLILLLSSNLLSFSSMGSGEGINLRHLGLLRSMLWREMSCPVHWPGLAWPDLT
jgi:hypothetical protein